VIRLVHVVDDEPSVRESLGFLLEAHGLVARLYEDAPALLARGELEEGCILTDVRMPGMSGLDLLGLLAERKHAGRLIVLTAHGDVPMAVHAMRLGAFDFVEKPFSDQVLLDSINAALTAARSDDGAAQLEAFNARLNSLTPRERQVFDHLLRGRTTKEIARVIAISPRTVEVYRSNVMSKMQANGLSELVRLCARVGLSCM